VLLGVFALAAHPVPRPGSIPGFTPDSPDYLYGAVSILKGHYLVDWNGPAHVPRYTPTFSLMLAPAVALGGTAAAVWVPYLSALALGALGAVLAWRATRPASAPLAVVAVLFWSAPIAYAGMIMSDLPATALSLGSLAVLTLGGQKRLVALAGALAGWVVVLRPGLSVLVVAGLAALTVREARLQLGSIYLLGTLPFVVALGAWQWATFGSPLVTGYQALGATDADGRFFALDYILGPPWNVEGRSPNLIAYLGALSGLTGNMLPPGLGLLGLAGLALLAWRSDTAAAVGRYGLASVAGLLLVHVPYFFQTERFLFVATSLLGIGAAVLLSEAATRLVRHVPWPAVSWLRSARVGPARR
jgi:hypothetical protein